MTVSNEDRDAMIYQIATHMAREKDDGANFQAWRATAAEYVDFVVSHGWGPRPAVSVRALEGFARITAATGSSTQLVDYLRECGIEVTDGN